MPLIRGHHSFDDHFAQIPNSWLRDERISLEARGLLAQIMSHRPGWRLSIKSLATQNHVGRDKVKRIIDELLTFGYLERSDKQEHDENGHLAGFSYTTKDPITGVTQEPYKAEPYKVSEPPKNTITKNTNISKNKKRVLSDVSDDFLPNETTLNNPKYAAIDIPSEVERFINWHQAKGIQNRDWQAAFRNWLKKALDYHASKDYKESEKERQKRELDAWVEQQMRLQGDSE